MPRLTFQRSLPAFLLLASPAVAIAATTLPAGGGDPFQNEQPSLALNYVVRTGGTYEELGEVSLFAGDFAPQDWSFAHGQSLSTGAYPDLFNKLGNAFGGNGVQNFALPDLRGRTPIGAGAGPGLTSYELGQKIGEEQATLGDVRPHSHAFGSGFTTGSTGQTQPHSNMQPSLALRPLIATQGTYPSRNSPPADGLPAEGIGASGAEPYLGEVVWVAHNNIPQGWARAEGQLVPVQNNESLFSLLGTMYGGDGRTTFALPDLRGRAAIGDGQGPGLSRWRMGEKGGQESETLTLSQTPSHSHELPGGLGDTQPVGGNAAQSNLQPSLGLRYVVPLAGLFPSQTPEAISDGPAAGLGGSTEPYIGSLSMVAFNYAPRSFADASGQLLPIAQYTALYSLIEHTYGGSFPTTFALPDLRGRVPMGVGQGAGLSDRTRGQQFGVQSSVLTVANLPEHTHEFVVAGDYNEDGTVDAADYSVWRDNVGEPPGALPNDDLGKPIGQAQNDVWRANYGKTINPSPAALQQATAPEPTAAWLTLCALGAAVLCRRS